MLTAKQKKKHFVVGLIKGKLAARLCRQQQQQEQQQKVQTNTNLLFIIFSFSHKS